MTVRSKGVNTTNNTFNTSVPNANPKYYYQALKLECLKLAFGTLGEGSVSMQAKANARNEAKELYHMITGEPWEKENL